MIVSNNKFKSINSFSRLFPTIYYDKSILSQPILDIWYNYKAMVFPKNLEREIYFFYTPLQEDNLYSISYKFYKTVEFWWLILLINDAINPLTFLDDIREGTLSVTEERKNRVIKILKEKYLHIIKMTMARIDAKSEDLQKEEI